MKVIPTHYNGNFFRGRTEARWAVFFDVLGIEYVYEPEGYDLGNGIWYLPDFWLPKYKLYVEIKCELPKDDDVSLVKAQKLAMGKSCLVLMLCGVPGIKFDGRASYRSIFWGSNGNWLTDRVFKECWYCDVICLLANENFKGTHAHQGVLGFLHPTPTPGIIEAYSIARSARFEKGWHPVVIDRQELKRRQLAFICPFCGVEGMGRPYIDYNHCLSCGDSFDKKGIKLVKCPKCSFSLVTEDDFRKGMVCEWCKKEKALGKSNQKVMSEENIVYEEYEVEEEQETEACSGCGNSVDLSEETDEIIGYYGRYCYACRITLEGDKVVECDVCGMLMIEDVLFEEDICEFCRDIANGPD